MLGVKGVVFLLGFLALAFGGLYFASADMSFLNAFVPKVIVDNWKPNLLFMVGFIFLGFTVAFMGVLKDE